MGYVRLPEHEGPVADAADFARGGPDGDELLLLRRTKRSSCYELVRNTLYCIILVLFALVLGICVGRKHPRQQMGAGGDRGRLANGLWPAQAFVPESTCLGRRRGMRNRWEGMKCG